MSTGMSLADARALLARLEEQEAEKQREKERLAAEAARQAARQAAKAAAEAKRVVEEGRQAAILKKKEDAKRRQTESRAKARVGSTATIAEDKPRNEKKRVRGESEDEYEDEDDDDVEVDGVKPDRGTVDALDMITMTESRNSLVKCKRCTTRSTDCAWRSGKTCEACYSSKAKCDGATWPDGVGPRNDPPRKARVTQKARLMESDDDSDEDELLRDPEFWTQLHKADRDSWWAGLEELTKVVERDQESWRAGLDTLTEVVEKLVAGVEAMGAHGARRWGEVETEARVKSAVATGTKLEVSETGETPMKLR